jgi:iron complex outermembrane recepter protein
MGFNASRLNAQSQLAALLGSVSLLTLANVSAYAQGEQVAQAEVAQAEEVPETILITGSLIRGTAAVGVPVINLAPQDFAVVGALTVADLFRTIPQAVVGSLPNASSSPGNQERTVRVNLRGLDSNTGTRSLFLVDGARHPAQTTDACLIDPSIIPQLAIERIDLLVDGASATYGSDAIGGVLNIILKRNFDGAVTQARFSTAAGGERRYQLSQLWGRTWDGGGVVLTYEWHQDTPAAGNFHSQNTIDHRPWGLPDRTPIGSSIPGTISRGAPAADPAVMATPAPVAAAGPQAPPAAAATAPIAMPFRAAPA